MKALYRQQFWVSPEYLMDRGQALDEKAAWMVGVEPADYVRCHIRPSDDERGYINAVVYVMKVRSE